MGDEEGPRSLSLLVLGPDEGELFISVGDMAVRRVCVCVCVRVIITFKYVFKCATRLRAKIGCLSVHVEVIGCL